MDRTVLLCSVSCLCSRGRPVVFCVVVACRPQVDWQATLYACVLKRPASVKRQGQWDTYAGQPVDVPTGQGRVFPVFPSFLVWFFPLCRSLRSYPEGLKGTIGAKAPEGGVKAHMGFSRYFAQSSSGEQPNKEPTMLHQKAKHPRAFPPRVRLP